MSSEKRSVSDADYWCIAPVECIMIEVSGVLSLSSIAFSTVAQQNGSGNLTFSQYPIS
jgi:hypothetical protein